MIRNLEIPILAVIAAIGLLLANTLKAQTPLVIAPYHFEGRIDTAILKVEFEMRYIPDTSQPKKKQKQEFELLLGKRFDQFRFIAESTDNGHKAPRGSGFNIGGEGLAASVFLTDRLSKQRTVYVKGIAPSHAVVEYSEDLASPEWHITPDTQMILGYTCQRATTKYFGREYIAWFAKDIPYSSGPWKLMGLPGLILQAYDTKGEYSFTATSIVYKPEANKFIQSIKGRFTHKSRKEVNRILKLLNQDIIRASEIINGRKVEVIGSAASVIPFPYNPIELE